MHSTKQEVFCDMFVNMSPDLRNQAFCEEPQHPDTIPKWKIISQCMKPKNLAMYDHHRNNAISDPKNSVFWDSQNLSQWLDLLDDLNDTGYDSQSTTMFTETLSTRQELVENLDTEPLFDYLRQHGVLDDVTEMQIREEKNKAERNIAILQHLDSHGNIAIGLFINALRQSGQLQLASSLDVTNRIQPIYGTGYWQKPRHKGQIAIEVQVLAVKTVLDTDGHDQSERHNDSTINQSMDRWISVEDVRMAMETGPCALSPRSRAYYKSFENMTILEQPEESSSPRTHKIQQFAYGDDESEVKKKSCFCLCLPKLFGHKKKDKKKEHSKTRPTETRKPSNAYEHSRSPSRASRQGIPSRQLFSPRKNSSQLNGSNLESDIVAKKNSINQHRTEENHNVLEDRMKQPEILGSAGNLSGDSPSDGVHTDVIDGIEQWISSVDILKDTSRRFYALFDSPDSSPHTQLLKYFEQERGLLTLETQSNERLVVVTICMTKTQLDKLRDDFDNGLLASDLENYLVTSEVLEAVGVSGVQLDVRIADEQFSLVEEELQKGR